MLFQKKKMQRYIKPVEVDKKYKQLFLMLKGKFRLYIYQELMFKQGKWLIKASSKFAYTQKLLRSYIIFLERLSL